MLLLILLTILLEADISKVLAFQVLQMDVVEYLNQREYFHIDLLSDFYQKIRISFLLEK
jgi:hypothetical protein